MPSPTESARQLLCSALELFSDGKQPDDDAFPWSSSRIANLTGEDKDLEEMRKDIQDAQAVEELLRRMLMSASAAVAKFKDRLTDTVNKREFIALPDEILAIIIEMVCQDSKDTAMVEHLSVVSRRFRQITLNLPVIWSRISSPELSIEKASLFASRATTPTISLSISGFSNQDTRSEFSRISGAFNLAVSISSRIQSMSIYLSDSDTLNVERVFKLSDASLPVLTELRIECDDFIGREVASLCRTWDAPSLRSLHAINILPEFSPEVASKLETCSITANRDLGDQELVEIGWRVSEILTFLLSLTSLKNLEVNVQLPAIDRVIDGTMSSVQSLTLCLEGSYTGTGTSDNIHQFIKFPNVSSFKLKMGVENLNFLGAMLHRTMDEFQTPLTSVTELSLAVTIDHSDLDEPMPMRIIGEWGAMFGGLKSFTLESVRDKNHGLFAFANSFDSLQLIDPKADTTFNSDFLAKLPSTWDRPRRSAVMDVENVGHSDIKNVVKFIDESNDI